MTNRASTQTHVVRMLCWGGFVLCVLTCLALLLVSGNDLDTDSVLPIPQAEQTVGPSQPSTTPSSPSSLAVAVLVALASVAALPALSPRKVLRFTLGLSIGLLAAFVALTVLRLGLVFTPVLAVLVAAFVLLPREGDARTASGVSGFD